MRTVRYLRALEEMRRWSLAFRYRNLVERGVLTYEEAVRMAMRDYYLAILDYCSPRP